MKKVGQNIKDVLNSIHIAICLIDKELNIVFVNAAFEEIFGYTEKNILNKKATDFLQRSFKKIFDDPLSFSNRVKSVYLNKNSVSNFECHLIPNKKRRERWIEYRSQFITRGLYKGGIIEQYIDITRAKKTEQTLYQNELKYINLVENSAIGVGISQNNKIIYANPALLKIFGYSSMKDFVTKPLIERVYVDDREKVLNRMKLLAEGKAEYPYTMEHRIVDTNKKIKTLSLQISEFISNGKHFSQATFVDITEAKIREFREKQLAIEAVQLEHKIKITEEIRKQIDEIVDKEGYEKATFNGLFNLLKEEIHLEKQWDFFKRKIDNIYPQFFKTLVEKHPNLTQKDLKHCALIKMAFDTKDIASILNVKPSSIQIARVRLKKKLNLTPEQNLKNYILRT